MESNGKLSVLPKSQARPIQPSDLGIPTNYEIPTVLIEDGTIVDDNLFKSNLDKAWLLGQLKLYGINDPKTVVVALLDTQSKFVRLQKK